MILRQAQDDRLPDCALRLPRFLSPSAATTPCPAGGENQILPELARGGGPLAKPVVEGSAHYTTVAAIPSGRTTGAGEDLRTAAHPERFEGPSPANPAPAVFGDGAHKYIPVAAMEAVLAERHRQIAKFGHTPQADAALPLRQLPREAARFVNMAIEDCQFHREGWHLRARKHLVRAGALILAAMDRIEAEPADEDPFIPGLSGDAP